MCQKWRAPLKFFTNFDLDTSDIVRSVDRRRITGRENPRRAPSNTERIDKALWDLRHCSFAQAADGSKTISAAKIFSQVDSFPTVNLRRSFASTRRRWPERKARANDFCSRSSSIRRDDFFSSFSSPMEREHDEISWWFQPSVRPVRTTLAVEIVEIFSSRIFEELLSDSRRFPSRRLDTPDRSPRSEMQLVRAPALATHRRIFVLTKKSESPSRRIRGD